MEITEVRIKLVLDERNRLRGFCSMTLDDGFVVRDLKIISGNKGMFVAMPSRKLMDKCPFCNTKNHLRAKFCNECGTRLMEYEPPGPDEERDKLHADIAHPINSQMREYIQQIVVKAYLEELHRTTQAGYASDIVRMHAFDPDDHGEMQYTAQPHLIPARIALPL